MASLELNHIYKVYQGGVKAVNDFTMKIEDKEFIVFVGPSGCGKSTTLRMIAGLEEISAGELIIGDRIVNDMQPKDRNIAMVFQNYALYPHMTVFDNIAYSLKINHTPKAEIVRKVNEAAKILGITEYLYRKPKALSGGQRQRVALGRAIVRNPKVFLLDEPLSNLDAKLRGDMRTEITKLHERLQTTFIYVTHDQVEAMTMGTRIVVMKDGYIQQIDTPKNIYAHPANKFVAGFIGTPQMNFFDMTMLKKGSKVEMSLKNGQEFTLNYDYVDHIPTTYMDGSKKCILGVRPDNVVLKEDKEEKGYVYVPVKVDVVEGLGAETLVYATIKTSSDENKNIILKTTKDINIKVGDEVEFGLDLRKIHVFDGVTEKSILNPIPDSSSLKGTNAGGVFTIKNTKIELTDPIKTKIQDGEVELNIPAEAFYFGKDANIDAKVEKVTALDTGKTLYELTIDGLLVFATSDDSSIKVGPTKVAIDQAKIEVVQGETKIEPFDNKVVLSGKLIKDTEHHSYLYEIEGKKVLVSQEQCQKLFNAKGKSILKTPLDFVTNAKKLAYAEQGDFTGTVEEIVDFKTERYAKINLGTKSIYVVAEKENVGDKITFDLDFKNVDVYDQKLKIILA